ncbi:MAG TPA: ABC transporter ATP-binding protein [Roseomonas sp.]|nr:ABC transporter ATP-binding protein [Roseomonas sp.]
MPSNAPAAHIEVEDLEIHYGPVAAVGPVSFSVQPGQQLTLLGPSGCGKTTTLRAIAGLERPSSGAIRIGGETMYSSARGINLPAERRGLSMVFQSYAIWPHMTVYDNVAYGLRVRRKSRAEVEEKVRRALDLVQMGQYADRHASQLSGGQQQRVALARACAFSPSVLLFDEPLSNLDAKLRGDMRIELRELQHRLGVTSLYVTHDLEEALAMSDRIVVMRAGKIEQIGPPDEIYNYPRTAFVADFVGSSNLIRGRLRPDLARDGLIALESEGGHIVHGVAHGRPAGAEPVLSVRTVHLRLVTGRPDGGGANGAANGAAGEEPVNVWPVTVRRSVFLGDLTELHVAWGGRELVVRCSGRADVGEGQPAFLSADPRHCVLLEAA